MQARCLPLLAAVLVGQFVVAGTFLGIAAAATDGALQPGLRTLCLVVGGASAAATALLVGLACSEAVGRACGIHALVDSLVAAWGVASWAVAGIKLSFYTPQPWPAPLPDTWTPEQALRLLSWVGCMLFLAALVTHSLRAVNARASKAALGLQGDNIVLGLPIHTVALSKPQRAAGKGFGSFVAVTPQLTLPPACSEGGLPTSFTFAPTGSKLAAQQQQQQQQQNQLEGFFDIDLGPPTHCQYWGLKRSGGWGPSF